ncbi:putative membrane protein, TIGR04086 family/integral membrane protein, TIGR04097 family [Desulfosporosinus acidiphilus SJ4]|uniref:Putative membrane protein, TIGR04086 family/integral membrane protein, TIGR04097 family n=1 Tax=Desulfosporosinus acidiphilus (strain DSM 22704 / JCM 16185 / SJ4) TaxID=646529 RepID=I4D864_DESAJ|nr:TIGR04086 family membrane protein [Desulfosporosinus acidiphilus]AFM41988.1 putative membrane protein, TIGR04086 family/integral membrane protein, TIGR04097 family [Desulfosporosinus acidiphilus SJ4]
MTKSFQLTLILKGILLATVLALLLSVVFGIVLSYTSVPESELFLNIIFGLSVFVASLMTAHQAGTKGLYYGLSIGLGFSLVVLVLSAVLWPEAPSWLRIGEKAIIALVSGGIGGIIGVLIPNS